MLVRARSSHSLGFGTASVEELAERAAALGISSIALTNIETLAGQIRFHDACSERGIRPVTGVELRCDYGRRSSGELSGRLILLARDAVGYASLCRIVSRRRTRPLSESAGETLDALASGSEGLFLLTDDAALLRRLLQLDTVDRESLRLLLVRPSSAESEHEVRAASAAMAMPLVADLDLVALDGRDAALHALLIAVRSRTTLAEVSSAGLDSAANGILEEAALTLFDDVPQAVLEANRMVEACALDLGSSLRIPPRPPELSGDEVVRELRGRCRSALAGGRASGHFRRAGYEQRLERELSTIERLGFADYFLAVAEVVRGAGELGVATAGRGSAAGSLAAHLLGISAVDPVESDLLFERFLHEKRVAPPDIDLDVASTGRAALNAWVGQRFGRERVAGVATYQTFRARSAVRAGLGALGVPRSKVEPVLGRLETGEASGEEEAALVERALAASPIPAVRDAAPLIRRLVGMPSHVSAHPGGIVIGHRPLEELAPLERAPNGAIVTQYDYRAVERAGFLKIDLLGNHFLSEKQEALAALPQGLEIPDDDESTWRRLDEADTLGCFQVESPAVRSVLRRLPIGGFSDLVAALAVVRPGAAAGAAKERFVRRARGEERFEPLEILGGGGSRPDFWEGWDLAAGSDGADGSDSADSRDLADGYAALRKRLQRSNGVLLYDEDIIRLLSTVGGISLADADSLRTAIVAAGEEPEALARLGADFVEEAVGSGASRPVAKRAWEAAARFASYSFAEAHAASYAVLAWQAAWLRTHAPLQFGCALINHHRGLYPLRTTAAAVQRWGITLLPPSVNRSQLGSTIERDLRPSVRVGLAAVKGLTKRTAGDILAGRPFAELAELIEHARPAKRELRSLLLSGACDDLPPLSSGGYPLVHDVMLEGLEGESSPDALRNVLDRLERLPGEGEDAQRFREYQSLVRVRNEVRYLEMHLSDHPMRLLRSEADRLGCLRSDQLGPRLGQTVRFAGLLAASQRVPTRSSASSGPGQHIPVRRRELRFLTFEDEAGLIEVVLFPEANELLGARLTTPGPYLTEGVVRETDGDLHLVVTELMPFHERS